MSQFIWHTVQSNGEVFDGESGNPPRRKLPRVWIHRGLFLAAQLIVGKLAPIIRFTPISLPQPRSPICPPRIAHTSTTASVSNSAAGAQYRIVCRAKNTVAFALALEEHLQSKDSTSPPISSAERDAWTGRWACRYSTAGRESLR